MLAITLIASWLHSETADCQPLNRSSSNQIFCDSPDDSVRGSEYPYSMEYTRSSDRLSTATAIGVSIFPGIFYHGVGHFYARKPVMGFTLLGLHLISGGAFLYLFFAEALSEDGQDVSDDAIWAAGLANASVWLADIVGSAIAVQRHNKRLGFAVDSKQGATTLCFQFTFTN